MISFTALTNQFIRKKKSKEWFLAVNPAEAQDLDNVLEPFVSQKENRSVDGVPRILWKSGPVLDKYTRVVLRKLAQRRPQWKVIFLDDQACHTFMRRYFSGRGQAYEAYQMLVPGAFKSDLFRACLLHRYGGVWSDMKQKFLWPLDEVFDLHANGSQLIQDIYVRDSEGKTLPRIYNALFAASPRSAYLQTCIDIILNHVRRRYTGSGYPDACLAITGPYAWQKAFNSVTKKQAKGSESRNLPKSSDEQFRIVGQLHLNVQNVPLGLGIFNSKGELIVVPKFYHVPNIKSGSYAQEWQNGSVYHKSLPHNVKLQN
mmetsp:Transcript_6154/g.9539  ORF Transcript_6154/g.9539 Transcript_6154/m.9539 type:complete len:315 (-) Transcript_6154:86-1030(-)